MIIYGLTQKWNRAARIKSFTRQLLSHYYPARYKIIKYIMRHGIIIVNMPVTRADCFVGSRQSDRGATGILREIILDLSARALTTRQQMALRVHCCSHT